MKKLRKKITACGLSAALILNLSGCAGGQTLAADEENGETARETAGAYSYSDRDWDAGWEESEAVYVTLSDGKITVEGDGAKEEDGILTVTGAGTYVLTGQWSDGQIRVEAGKNDKIQLVLNGAAVTCKNSAPLFVSQADKVFLTLADYTENSLTDGASYQLETGEDEPDAALFSKEDLTINGGGSLLVNGNYKDGIVSKDSLVITGGEITVTAKEDGIRGKDSVAVGGGTITVEAGLDGIKSNEDADAQKGFLSLDGGTVTITAGNDGIQAETALYLNGGEYDITAGGGSGAAEPKKENVMPSGGKLDWENGERPERTGGRELSFDEKRGGATPGGMDFEGITPGAIERKNGQGAPPEPEEELEEEESAVSTKGVKAGTSLNIAGGSLTVNSQDDAVHANGSITISGGTLQLKTGDDGIHADASLLISGGTVTISESYEGLEGNEITISGGTIRLKASDDGINAAGEGQEESSLTVEGGEISVEASGDGIDSNGKLTISGGTVLVNGPTNGGDGALDYNGRARITGGVLLAAGSSGMAQNVTEAEGQGAILVNFNEAVEAQTRVTLVNTEGTAVLSFVPEKAFQSVVFSSPELKKGESYTLYTGGTISGAPEISREGTLEGGTQVIKITLDQTVVSISEDGSEIQSGFMGGSGRGFRK